MFWVLKRTVSLRRFFWTVSLRRFFWVLTTYVLVEKQENLIFTKALHPLESCLTLHVCSVFSSLCCCLLTFFISFFKKLFGSTISQYPDQGWHSVGPDLNPNFQSVCRPLQGILNLDQVWHFVAPDLDPNSLQVKSTGETLVQGF